MIYSIRVVDIYYFVFQGNITRGAPLLSPNLQPTPLSQFHRGSEASRRLSERSGGS